MDGERSELESDFQVFESHRKEWLEHSEGKYVVIHQGNVAGFYDDYAAGLRAGVEQFGPNAKFLVQQICVEEPVFVIY